MSIVKDMLQAHPLPNDIERDLLRECIDACAECALACTACADACLGEENPRMLARCIRIDLDCADVCAATGQMLMRQLDVEWNIVESQVRACQTAVRLCAEECDKHARRHDHCRICAEACRRCQRAASRLLGALAPAE